MIFGPELAKESASNDEENFEKNTIFWKPYRPQSVNWVLKFEKSVKKRVKMKNLV